MKALILFLILLTFNYIKAEDCYCFPNEFCPEYFKLLKDYPYIAENTCSTLETRLAGNKVEEHYVTMSILYAYTDLKTVICQSPILCRLTEYIYIEDLDLITDAVNKIQRRCPC